MFFATQREALNVARTEAQEYFKKSGVEPKVLSAKNASTFFSEFGYAIRLIAQEKEILFFAALQWVTIAFAYTIWTQMLDWIPDSVWDQVGKDDNELVFNLVGAALVAWSFFVVMVASYPIAILNAAMTAAHYLRSSGQPSTVARCFDLAFKNLGRLWVFTTIDAWITVNAILDRMPRKRNNRTALDELLYYAWKIGTMGVVPSLVAGKGYIEAARQSVQLLINQPLRAVGIRMGYSLICWIIGIAAYIGGFYYFLVVENRIVGRPNEIYNFYLFAAVPIVIAVGITAVMVRPFYLIMVSKLYTDVLPLGEDALVPPAGRKFDVLALIFAGMLCVLLALYFFGDQLGFRDWIESLAARDFSAGKMF